MDIGMGEQVLRECLAIVLDAPTELPPNPTPR